MTGLSPRNRYFWPSKAKSTMSHIEGEGRPLICQINAETGRGRSTVAEARREEMGENAVVVEQRSMCHFYGLSVDWYVRLHSNMKTMGKWQQLIGKRFITGWRCTEQTTIYFLNRKEEISIPSIAYHVIGIRFQCQK